MIKAILDFLQIHWEVKSGDAAIIIQDMFRIAPKSFNAIDVIARGAIHHVRPMLHTPMHAKALQRIVAAKRVRVVHGTLAGMGLDVRQQLLGRDILDDFRVHSAVAFQKPQHDTFSGGAASAFAFPSSAKITFVNLDLAAETITFQLRNVIQCFAQSLIDTCHRRIRHAKIDGNAIRRLHLIKSLKNCNFSTQLRKAFLSLTMGAFDIAAAGAACLVRPAKNALATTQKVGRTTQMTSFSNNHKVCKLPNGYDSI